MITETIPEVGFVRLRLPLHCYRHGAHDAWLRITAPGERPQDAPNFCLLCVRDKWMLDGYIVREYDR